ncbi:MAG: ribonuclease R [Planctomycetota bacterium]
MVDRDDVLDFVKSPEFQSMPLDDIAAKLDVADEEKDKLREILEELQHDGHVVRMKGRHWVDPLSSGLVVGKLECNSKGFGFLCPFQEEVEEDVYISEAEMGEAMHRDVVVAEYKQKKAGKKDKGPAGRILKVLHHENKQVVGTFIPGKKFSWVAPDDPRLFRDVYVAAGDEGGAEKDDKVVVNITQWPTLHRSPEGEVVNVLGKEGEPGVDVMSVIKQFSLRHEWPGEVLEEAKSMDADPSEEEKAERTDRREHTTLTIDPEDAKDFDDALSLFRDPDSGNRVALVHIADVSHFVRPETELDKEAQRRAMSVYLASDVVPMFPEEQSRDVLSLVADKDRFAKTVRVEFDDRGKVKNYSLEKTVVRVDERMTYNEVQDVLDAHDSDEETMTAPVMSKYTDEVLDLVLELDELAMQRRRRQKVGSVDLDVPEYDVDVNDRGEVIAVSQIERDRSHELVEELMLIANRAVANYMKRKDLPALYRVHDEPEEEGLEEFAAFIKAITGRDINPLDRGELQELLRWAADSPYREAVNMQLLRAMQRAQYNTESRPHFALHFDDYCHFTSPVRRYPDLAVHQVLDAHIDEGQAGDQLRNCWDEKLGRMARHCNEVEYRADEAEREIINLKLLRFLQDHKKEVFDAVVTGVVEFGMFVRLEDYSIEGLVRVEDMKNDFYRLDSETKALVGTRTNNQYQLGQEVRVVLDRIDMARREVDFLLHGEE